MQPQTRQLARWPGSFIHIFCALWLGIKVKGGVAPSSLKRLWSILLKYVILLLNAYTVMWYEREYIINVVIKCMCNGRVELCVAFWPRNAVRFRLPAQKFWSQRPTSSFIQQLCSSDEQHWLFEICVWCFRCSPIFPLKQYFGGPRELTCICAGNLYTKATAGTWVGVHFQFIKDLKKRLKKINNRPSVQSWLWVTHVVCS